MKNFLLKWSGCIELRRKKFFYIKAGKYRNLRMTECNRRQMCSDMKKKHTLIQLVISVVKMAAAAGLAWELAKLAGSKHPYLAPLSVILCLKTTILQSARYSFHRVFGTAIGAVVTVWAAAYLPMNGWTLACLLAIVSIVPLLIERNETFIHEVALSVLLVFALLHQNGPHYAIDRIRDTFIGAATVLAIHIVFFPPNFTKEVQQMLDRLSKELAGRFAAVAAAAEWMRETNSKDKKKEVQQEARSFQEALFQAEKRLEQAFESLRFNPFARKSRTLLQKNKELLTLIRKGDAYLEKAVAAISDWTVSGKMTDAERQLWADRLRNIGRYWSDSNPAGAPYHAMQLTLPEEEEAYRYSTVLLSETSELLQQIARLPYINP
jgi:uncharacterized membrane protein YgaE (UPF0421/DUF939 family)